MKKHFEGDQGWTDEMQLDLDKLNLTLIQSSKKLTWAQLVMIYGAMTIFNRIS